MPTLLLWWLAASVLGWIALPLSFFTFRHLPDRGYAASRALGLLLVSYFAWILGYGLGPGAAIVAGVVVVLAASTFFGRGRMGAQWQFLKQRASYVAVVEILFFVVLALGMHYKTAVGAIYETEKPADFTLLQGVMNARHMPPHDPWLSGASISYYYFGYFIVALVARVTGTPAGIAFNMGLALVWALTAVMGLALGYGLTARRRYGLLLAFALSLMGNMDYWFRAVHVYQYGDLREKYLTYPDNPKIAAGASGVVEYLFDPLSHNLEYYHASRIIDANEKERLITEFPAFSFFLGDLHPHVMALPFFVLALCLALALLKAPRSGWEVFGARRGGQAAQLAVCSIVFGSLGFLNSWDLPTVMLVLAACLALRELWATGALNARWFRSFASVGLPLAALAATAYLPFYRALQTQLQGVQVVKDRTDLFYWPFLFGAFLLVLVPALVQRARVRGTEPASAPAASADRRKKERTRKPARRSTDVPAAPGAPARPQCVLCGRDGVQGALCQTCGGEIENPAAGAALPDAALRQTLIGLGARLSGHLPRWRRALLPVLAAVAVVDLVSEWDPAVTLFSLVLAGLAVASLGARGDSRERSFAAVLAAFGFVILAACEWVYFKDLFAIFPHLARMNTVFKFYIHAWVLLAAAAVGLLDGFLREAWPRWSPAARGAWAVLAGVVAIGACVYPVLTLQTRDFRNPFPYGSIDGTEYFRAHSPADARAVEWLREHAPWTGDRPPVILEAWGTSFTAFGRVATFTGFSTVFGWEGHEEQWRGGKETTIRGGIDAADTVRRRYEDVGALYGSTDGDATRQRLDRYGIQYVYVGDLERKLYPADALAKWPSFGERVYAEDGIEIYAIRR
jgi:uncharacterized membrane protein